MREVATELLDSAPSSVAGATLALRAASLLGGVPGAVDVLRANLQEHPEHASGWLALASRLRDQGLSAAERDEAAAALARARVLLPECAGCTVLDAYLLIAQNKTSEALVLLEPLQDSGDTSAQLAACDALAASGELARATEIAAHVLAVIPDSPFECVRLSSIRLAQGAPRDAASWAIAAFDAGGPWIDAYRTYGRALLALGEPEAAARAFEDALAMNPEQPSDWVALSIARNRAHDKDGARIARAEARRRLPGTWVQRTVGLESVAYATAIGWSRPLRAAARVLYLATLVAFVSGLYQLGRGDWGWGGVLVTPGIVGALAMAGGFARAGRRGMLLRGSTLSCAALVLWVAAVVGCRLVGFDLMTVTTDASNVNFAFAIAWSVGGLMTVFGLNKGRGV